MSTSARNIYDSVAEEYPVTDYADKYLICGELTDGFYGRKPGVNIISADFREDKSGIADILREKYGFEVNRICLKCGDFVIGGEIAVERKTAADFVQSIMDGRLFSQAAAMRKAYASCLMIVEGNVFETGFNIHVNAVKGAVVSLAVIWKIPVLFTKSSEDTASYIELIATQRDEAANGLYSRFGRRPKQFCRQQSYVLQGFPGIGPKLAQGLLEHFGSIYNVVAAAPDELIKIHGLGMKKACGIRDILMKNLKE